MADLNLSRIGTITILVLFRVGSVCVFLLISQLINFKHLIDSLV